MGRKILIGVVVVIAVFLVVVATRPAAFHVERSLTMAAAPAAVFVQVNDFHAWPIWSPWEQLDPRMKRSFSGAPSGAGAVYAWQGNDQVGEGRMTLEKSERPSRIEIKLEFFKPWTATNTATFSFVPSGAGTKTTWAMDGANNFMAKAVSMFMDMDKLIGADFERGLQAMRVAAERGVAQP